MDRGSATSDDLADHLHCLTSYCLPRLQLLLDAVDPGRLSEETLAELEEFDFHYIPEVGLRSVTFINGPRAVQVLRGVREGRWTREAAQAAVQGAIAKRLP